MQGTDPTLLFWFFPLTLPIAVWVAWSDMKFMKIPNKAVIAMAIVYLVTGLLVFPFDAWVWGWAMLFTVLVIGIISNISGLIGAGDVKFAAAMAPFFTGADLRVVLALFAACLLGAFFSHRLMKQVPAFRNATADWASWANPKFPMGLALSGVVISYPFLGLWLG
jgi:prepilin peptidase CpaA